MAGFKYIAFHALAWGLLLVGTAAPGVSFRIGSPEDAVYDELGPPQGQMNGSGYKVIFYDGGGIEIKNGAVSRIDPQFDTRAKGRKETARAQASAAESGVTAHAARYWNWMRAKVTGAPPPPRTKAYDPALLARRAAGMPAVTVLATGGEEVPPDALMVEGMVTIVDFYADWCSPCRQISPRLEELAASDPEVFLRKVDIVSWQSPVARQYQLHSIPNIRVYNREGQMIGTPTSDYDEVVKLVAAAK